MTSTARLACVHSLDHFALRVPDLHVAASFYEAFGLSVARVGEVLTLKCAGSGHVWGRVMPGASKSLGWLSFGCADTDYRGLLRQLEAAGAQRRDGPREAESGGSWFADPDGNLLQVKVGPKVSANARRGLPAPPPADRLRGVEPGRRQAQRVRPARLSHVMLFSPDVPRQSAFYTAGLGLAVSDTSLDLLAFLCGQLGSDHHLLAFAKSPRPGFHHAAWEVADLAECGMGAMQMRDAGHADGWGVGRHGAGANHFHYVRDPWGSFCEYASDIDFVPPGGAWQPAMLDPLAALHYWGPEIPEDFLRNHETPSPLA